MAPARFAATVRNRIARKIRRLTGRLFDTYRPEQHYMRGPGPKWHAKHRPARASNIIL